MEKPCLCKYNVMETEMIDKKRERERKMRSQSFLGSGDQPSLDSGLS